MHNPASLLEYNTHKFLWDFDIQTDHLISVRRPNNNQQQKKRICKIVDFAVPADQRIKLRECKKKDEYLDFARQLKKNMEHAGENHNNCNWCVWNSN